MDEETFEQAFRLFERQSEVDYFINKDARSFLREQFNLWVYQYIFSGESQWSEARVNQLQVLKDIAYKIIDFISQFEDELVKIWNKPKFVLNSNYVITLDRIEELNPELVNRILAHTGIESQIQEWHELGIVGEDFKIEDVWDKDQENQELSSRYRYLPLDTIHFKELEIDILGLFDNLDQAIDGWLIKSENYQALNTVLPKFRDFVQCIYIDPPFNKAEEADYFYSVNYKDASWISILENRLRLSKDILGKTGSIYVKCDYNGNMFVRMLMNLIFGEDRFRSEITWKRRTSSQVQYQHFAMVTDTIFCYSKTHDWIYNQQFKEYTKEYIESQFRYTDKEGRYLIRNFYAAGSGPARVFFGKSVKPPNGSHWRYSQENLDPLCDEGRIVLDKNGFPKLKQYLHEMRGNPNNSLITDIYVVQGSSKESCRFPTQNPEKLLQLFILSSTNERDLVLDYFLGSGTTSAAAHKLNRKWIGVELADYFDEIVLPRMKRVVSGEQSGISEETNWKGGGFFKYYMLEQYEDSLKRVQYEDADLFENPYEDPYSNYVFLRDIKMLDAVETDRDNDETAINLCKLYEGIDLAETLSCISGKWIKRITKEYVEFEDGERAGLQNPDLNLVKPLIWW